MYEICAYCGRDREEGRACRGCGSAYNRPGAVLDPRPPWDKAEPFIYRGLLVKVDHAWAMDETVVGVWRGTEFLGEVHLPTREMVQMEGQDMMPLVLEKFMRIGVEISPADAEQFRRWTLMPLPLSESIPWPGPTTPGPVIPKGVPWLGAESWRLAKDQAGTMLGAVQMLVVAVMAAICVTFAVLIGSALGGVK